MRKLNFNVAAILDIAFQDLKLVFNIKYGVENLKYNCSAKKLD